MVSGWSGGVAASALAAMDFKDYSIGGLAVGAMVGAAAAQPRYYAPPPAYVAEPAPVYVAPGPRCYWTRGEPTWDGYRGMWVRPRIQVCD